MSTEIYYFSGSGNSLFIARELQKRIPNSAIFPIARLLKEDSIVSLGASVGFVFPVHALTIPIAVRKFLRKIELAGAQYVFAAATRQGTVFYGFRAIDRLLRKQGKRLDAQFIVDMCSNESRRGGYHVPDQAEIAACERKAMEKVDAACEMIREKGRHVEDIRDHKIKSASSPVSAFLVDRLVVALMGVSEHIGGVNYFYHDGQCTGCGLCEKVCLSGKISMVDGKPVWNRDKLCHMCFACLNFCPAKAVQIKDIPCVKSHTMENGRYPHPYARAEDMTMQK